MQAYIMLLLLTKMIKRSKTMKYRKYNSFLAVIFTNFIDDWRNEEAFYSWEKIRSE